MGGRLIRALTTDKQIRALTVDSTEVVRTARKYHRTTPVATAALGRVLSAALMMGSMVKSGEVTSLKVEGDGPLGKIIAEANQYGEVRGYVMNSGVETKINSKGKLDVAGAVGKGYLIVRKKTGLKEPYEGKVPLVSGEIGEDLTYYFTKSEQIPSSVGLGVLVDRDMKVRAAGGFIIQLMPEAEEKTIQKLEKNLAIIKSPSRLIDNGLTAKDLMGKILGDFDYRILSSKEVKFKCQCNKEMIKDIMVSLGEEELKQTLQKQGKVEIKCHFCGKKYKFNEKEIKKVLTQKNN
ncbi:MAG: Hsp33 family molecular chaperone HslO [Halanaerobiales bacterium]